MVYMSYTYGELKGIEINIGEYVEKKDVRGISIPSLGRMEINGESKFFINEPSSNEIDSDINNHIGIYIARRVEGLEQLLFLIKLIYPKQDISITGVYKEGTKCPRFIIHAILEMCGYEVKLNDKTTNLDEYELKKELTKKVIMGNGDSYTKKMSDLVSRYRSAPPTI